MSTKTRFRKNRVIAWISLIALLTGYLAMLPSAAAAQSGDWLISQGRLAYASTTNGADYPIRATDGDYYTFWQAVPASSNQWIDIDFGTTAQIHNVTLYWHDNASYATKYKLLVSDDEINWTEIYANNNGTGGVPGTDPSAPGVNFRVEEITQDFNAAGRYIRLLAETCVSGWGVGLKEFAVYGQGGMTPKPAVKTDLALNKPVFASSYAQPWWAANPEEKAPEKAVDGNYNTNWLSEGNMDEWLYVDLGAVYTVGEVSIEWEVEFGRVYEIQTSLNGTDWTVVYRQLDGLGEDEYIKMYQQARFVKMQGVAMGRGSGYTIRRLRVYEYAPGDPQTNPAVQPLPTPTTVQAGKGSYLTDDVTMYHPRTPKYVTDNVTVPIPSNDWWTSIIYTRLSDGMPALPYMFHYYDTGLGIYYASDLFTAPNNGGMDTKSVNMDLTVTAGNILGAPSARCDGFGDYSADVLFSDDDTPKMRSTLIKGSPYVYNTFTDPNAVEVSAQSIRGFFDDSNNPILVNDGDIYVGDHVGIETSNRNTAPVSIEQIRSYALCAPPGTKFVRVGSKLKIQLGSGENYLTIGALTKRSDLNYVYQHAYAVVTDTVVSYEYDETTTDMITTFTGVIDRKRADLSGDTLIALLPHQWKYTDAALTNMWYRSARGAQKVLEGNTFNTTVRFNGITPSFGEPTESGSYSRADMLEYLDMFKDSVTRDYWVADPYWQGKKTHPLAMGILIAEELGEYETRDQFLRILKAILADWLTYDGPDDIFFMYYSPSWGAINGQGGDHGMGINLSDHHFLWAYFIYPAAVLASYDPSFVRDYGDMVEHLIRDCMNPDRDDPLYPWMRNFDPFEAHSWAGGYGDNQSGNNQESSSEATFAWAGLYLWGLATGNDEYRDAGIWGFTSEVNAIEQYWFDYDQDNWSPDYTSGCVGMVWGSAYTNGTYFSGNPCCIYGIHWLPVTPTLTYFGFRPDVTQRIWDNYVSDQVKYQQKLQNQVPPAADPEGWFHILWPYQANCDPAGAVANWNAANLTQDIPNDECFNSYWYIQNAAAKGLRDTTIWADNYTGYQVFKKGNTYSAVIWNPTDEEIYVEFRNAGGVIGSAYVPSRTTMTCDPFVFDSRYTKPPSPDPDMGTPVHYIPCAIDAEDYYSNFSCAVVNCPDKGSGKGVGYFRGDGGSYLLYDVVVPETGLYTFEFRLSKADSGLIQILSDQSADTALGSTGTVPEQLGAWNYGTVSATATLQAGEQRLKILIAKGGFDLNWVKIYKYGEDPPANPGDDPWEKAPPGNLLSRNKQAYASTAVGGQPYAGAAFDGLAGTRWESASADPQWIYVDLGSVCQITGVILDWETAAGKVYAIQVSNDGQAWTTVYTKANGENGATFMYTFPEVQYAQYVRMLGTERTTGYGYSLWEFGVYGYEGGKPPASVTGKIRSYNPNNPATVKLMQGGAEKYSTAIAAAAGFGQTDQTFTFDGVAPGNYTLVVAKPGHTSFTVQTVTVGDANVDLTLDSRDAVKMMILLCGDINGDEMINDNDLIVLWQAANYNKNIAQAANPLCDLNGDGVINDNDLIILWLAVNYNKGPVVVA